jgi:hypothetical protein
VREPTGGMEGAIGELEPPITKLYDPLNKCGPIVAKLGMFVKVQIPIIAIL